MDSQLFAFVLMPFDARFDDIYKLGIKAAAEELGVVAMRVDEQVFHDEGILERIYNQIEAADVIIADMTGMNPNVFYEVGYAHAKGKICILLTAEAKDIPFDLKHKRHIIYGASIANLRQRLVSDLVSIKEEIANQKNPVVVELVGIDGDLITTKYSAIAKISIKFDLHNRTNSISPDIEAVYFYTGAGWRFKQDGYDCAESASDIADYTKRYLIKPPLPRLMRDGWAQIKLLGEKTLATVMAGHKLKDEYEVSGRALVRIATARNNFDYPVNLSVRVSDIPF